MTKPARWVLPDVPIGEINDLARNASIAPVAARVLWRRGYRDSEAVRRFLDAPLSALHDPFLLKDMRRAVDRLQRAIAAGENILLYGDYDVDGSTSVVILKTAIELAGGKATFHVPDRFSEGYGMQPAVIEAAAGNGISLIVSVDTGIRATEAIERARELGVDVIITDHHLPEATLPPAFAILNPNRPDCPYPDKNLCGAGVAFKLIQALLASLPWPAEKTRRILKSFLKMVAIATVADVVPLRGENRIIVKHGLEGLRSVRNPGLRALLDIAGIREGERPSTGQVAFRIAPRINAAGRMASAGEVVDLFLTADTNRARSLATQLHELNQERQQTEAEMVRRILDDCVTTPVTDDQAALVFDGEGWHRGVVGIVATRLVEHFHRPVFVLSVDGESELAQGSGRSIPPFHLLEALESMSDLFLRFGGHRQAAGLSLPADRVAEFRQRLCEYAAEHLSPDDFRPVREFDAVLDFEETDEQAVADILAMEPFGFGNPAPLFAAMGVEVAGSPVRIKEKHLRVNLRRGGRLFLAKAWNFAGRLGELAPGSLVDAALALERDAWNAAHGGPGWGFVLKDVRPATNGVS